MYKMATQQEINTFLCSRFSLHRDYDFTINLQIHECKLVNSFRLSFMCSLKVPISLKDL